MLLDLERRAWALFSDSTYRVACSIVLLLYVASMWYDLSAGRSLRVVEHHRLLMLSCRRGIGLNWREGFCERCDRHLRLHLWGKES